ncbi:hypothetical protein [Sulfobacillus thermosulfidooxidans]|uniref:hypothetical protein n=1 Tax=Sulfobacillus thermosulfidooxidans TaxID=28034 RepID=UPI00048D49ED|nr:hypothetical protein [Sulfobacillus thermosulfidooxidans]
MLTRTRRQTMWTNCKKPSGSGFEQVQQVLLTKTPQQSYHLDVLQEMVGSDVPYAHKGQRTDVLLKNIPRTKM